MSLTTNHFTGAAVVVALSMLTIGCGGEGESTGQSEDKTREVAAGNALVFQGRQSVQCGPPGLSPEQGAQTLINGGIDVLQSGCGVTTSNAIQPAVCGAADGKILLHEIRRENVADAERLGLHDVETLRNPTTGAGYIWVDCDTGARLP